MNGEAFPTDVHPSEMDDLVRAHRTRLDHLEREAIAYLDRHKPRLGLVVAALGFAGDEASVVLAHLVSKSRFAHATVFPIDTGVEPEGGESFADAFLARYGAFRVEKTLGKDLFWKALRKLGPHALDARWYETTLENLALSHRPRDLASKLLLLGSRVVTPHVIVLHGSRDRAEPAHEGDAWVTALRPLAPFTDLDLRMYIHDRKLPLPPAHARHQRLEAEIGRWQKKLEGSGDASPAPRRLPVLPPVEMVIAELEAAVTWGPATFARSRSTVTGRIHPEIQLPELARWFEAFGPCSLADGVLVVRPAPDLSISITADGSLHLTAGDAAALKELQKLVHGWALLQVHCIQCGGCVRQSRDVVLEDDHLHVTRKLRPETMQAIFAACPVHPEGAARMLRPASPETRSPAPALPQHRGADQCTFRIGYSASARG